MNNWKLEKLGNVTHKIGSGATPRGGKNVYLDKGIPIIRSQNIYNDYFNYSGLAFISKKSADELKNVVVFKNDNLINITGDSVCRTNIVPDNLVNSRVNQHVMIVRPIEKLLNFRYLHYFFISPQTQQTLFSFADSGGTRKALTKEMVSELEIPLPPLHIQQKIAEILGALDDKIELNRQMNQTLEAIARAIFKSWFVDFDPVYAKMEGRDYPLPPDIMDLFPDEMEESELGLIPKGWKVGELGEIIEIHDSKRIPLSKKERSERKGIYPYYGATKIVDYIDDYIFDGIFLLVGEDGSVITDDGNPFLQYVWGRFWANNHAHVLSGKNGFSVEFNYLLLKKTNISPFITGAVQLKLNQENMKSIPIIVPPNNILIHFTNEITHYFSKIRNNDEQLETLSRLRELLLPKLLNGILEI